jgi:putative ATPase
VEREATMDLFEYGRKDQINREAPLAARMRPRTLDEFVGQEHIVGPGRLLRRAIQADQLSSLIFYGPPGSGKTTLAQIIANTTRGHFIVINAVLAGVKDIRDAIEVAKERRAMYGQRTILFVEEVHRWNKAQQDALLPWVENGTVILIGATTENPYFEVIKPLVSRSRIFQLKSLTQADLFAVARQALADPERGYGRLNVQVDEDALAHLVDVANGDARSLLNALELAVETTPPGSDGVIRVDLAVAEESIQRRAVLYDKEGDVHYDTISAFIKSLRGSDPDAALYWMARMIYAGEDPRFIFRRMLIFAGEDVGLADPNALRVVVAAAQAFDYVGLPEGRFHLAEAALYLATAPKSNSALAFFDALVTVEKEQETEVPTHLRDASRDSEGFGHGAGYLYPHAYRDHWVAQQYLPDSLQGRVFYQPGDQGYEKAIKDQVARRREAQLAAMIEGEAVTLPEVLTFTGELADRGRDRWLARTISGASQRLAVLRDRVLDAVKLQRHHLVLDLNAGTGLLTWEALRRVPEGGVFAVAYDTRAAEALRQQAAGLPEVERPVVLDLVEGSKLEGCRLRPEGLRRGVGRGAQPEGFEQLLTCNLPTFDAIVGRNALTREPDKAAAARVMAGLLRSGGVISLAEIIPRHTQRLYRLVDLAPLGEDLARRVVEAEEAIYGDPADPMVNWDAGDLPAAFTAAGLAAVHVEMVHQATEVRITPAHLARWFTAPGTDAGQGGRASYGQHLGKMITPVEFERVQSLFEHTLPGRTVAWSSATAFVIAKSG